MDPATPSLALPAAGVCLTFAAFSILILLHRCESGIRLLSRPGWGDLFLLAALSVAALLALALTGRPLLSIGLPALLLSILMVLNRAKTAVLGEPLLFSDVYMLRQMLFFPAFYFPYIPIRSFLLLFAALAAATAAALFSNYTPPALSPSQRITAGVLAGACILWALLDAAGPGAATRWGRRFSRAPLAFAPKEDGTRFGLAYAAYRHAVWHYLFKQEIAHDAAPCRDGLSRVCTWSPCLREPLGNGRPPHVLLLQAESFFHLQRLFPGLGADWTANFDRLAAQGRHGLLQVNCYGAYTIRTEFSVLTGIRPESLKTYAFNPYALAAASTTGALPRWFAAQGYETLCLHPGSGAFLDRCKAMPNLGFSRFLERKAFAGSPTCGPYVSDAALAQCIGRELATAEKPHFIFAITIEAHGPWMPGRLTETPFPEDASPLPDQAGQRDGGLAAYARHLRNTDRMLGDLSSLAARLDRPLLICLYGDHLGSLPRGTQLKKSQVATDFLIWHSGDSGLAKAFNDPDGESPVPEESLGALLLAAAHAGTGSSGRP